MVYFVNTRIESGDEKRNKDNTAYKQPLSKPHSPTIATTISRMKNYYSQSEESLIEIENEITS